MSVRACADTAQECQDEKGRKRSERDKKGQSKRGKERRGRNVEGMVCEIEMTKF